MRPIEALEIDSQAQAHAAQAASAPATLTSARGSLGEEADPRPYHQRARLTPFGSEPWDYGTTEAA